MKGFSSGKFSVLILLIAIITSRYVFSQENINTAKAAIDPASFIGFTLQMLFDELGMPTSVHAVRGNEAWQDDVVFVYPSIEVYIFKDRVWQVCPVSVYNMKIGDSIDQVKTVMGEPLVTTEQYLLYRFPGEAWSMMFRVNLNQEKKAAAFFIYRSDF